SNYGWLSMPKLEKQPIRNAITVFTDTGKKSRKAVATWQEGKQWKSQLLQAEARDSLQTLELLAILWVLQHWLDVPVNVVSDSLYAVGIVTRIEDSVIKQVKNKRLWELLL
ncbi:POK19 protein, partial [Indicator maculatus]|nr:POK19 protein [Indicator maculatus]